MVDEGEERYELVFLQLVLVLALGNVTRAIIKDTSAIPYTVMMYCYGVVFGTLQALDKSNAIYYGSQLGHLDGSLLLAIFLPILLFEAGYFMDLDFLQRLKFHSALLAGPGVLIAMIGMGMTFWLFQSNISGVGNRYPLFVSLLSGTVLAPTDPVAVVSILKASGAPATVSAFVEGEAMFNDGLTLIMYNAFNHLVAFPKTWEDPETRTEWLWAQVASLPLLIFVGPVFGWLQGRMITYFIKFQFNDPLSEVSATVIGAYTSYMLAEMIGTSGVLSLVSYAIVMNYRRSSVSPEVEHFLLEVWHLVVYVANTVIFFIQGMQTVQEVEEEGVVLHPEAILRILTLFVAMNLIRFTIMGAFFPLFKLFGHADWKVVFVSAFGGLRGAVSVILCISAREAACNNWPENKHNCWAMRTATVDVGFLIALSLLFNGLMTKRVLDCLGLSQMTPIQAQSIGKGVDYAERCTDSKVQELKMDPLLADAPWPAICSQIRLLHGRATALTTFNLSQAENLEASRQNCAQAFAQHVHQIYLDGRGRNATIRRLYIYACMACNADLTLDVMAQRLVKDYLENAHLPPKGYVLGNMLKKTCDFLGLKMHIDYRQDAYDFGFHFVLAQEEVLESLDKLCLDEASYDAMMQITQRSIDIVKRSMDKLAIGAPHIEQSVKAMNAARIVLNEHRKALKYLVKEGSLAPMQAEKLINDVEKGMQNINELSAQASLLQNPHEVLVDMYWFQSLTGSQKAEILECEVLEADAGDLFDLASGDLMVTVSGIIKWNDPMDSYSEYNGPRSVFGVLSAICGENREGYVVAKTRVKYYRVPAAKLKELLEDWRFTMVTVREVALRMAAAIAFRYLPYAQQSQLKVKSKVEKGFLLNLTGIPPESGQLTEGVAMRNSNRVTRFTQEGIFGTNPQECVVHEEGKAKTPLLIEHEYVLLTGKAQIFPNNLTQVGPCLLRTDLNKEVSARELITATFSPDAWVVTVPIADGPRYMNDKSFQWSFLSDFSDMALPLRNRAPSARTSYLANEPLTLGEMHRGSDSFARPYSSSASERTSRSTKSSQPHSSSHLEMPLLQSSDL